jgi:hypothetical protein
MFCACGTIQYVPIETIKTEYRDKIVRDSIFRYDSVYIKEKGDTLIMERYRYIYKDKIIRDSIFVNDTIRIPYPVEVIKQVKKPLNGWQNFQIWCGRIAFGVIMFFIFRFILKKKRLF